MKKNYVRWKALFAALPCFMISAMIIFGIIDDCYGLGSICVLEFAFDDFGQIFLMIIFSFIGIAFVNLFIKSVKAKPELVELKLKKIEVSSPSLILVFEYQNKKELLYFLEEDKKDKYIVGKYYKVMMTKDKIYDLLD